KWNQMPETIAAHGGSLVDRFIPREQQSQEAARAGTLPRIPLSRRQISDLELIAAGAVSPLTGFMTADDYRSVVRSMHLASGQPWTIPVTLAVEAATAQSLRP